jgi:hypothetical protein
LFALYEVVARKASAACRESTGLPKAKRDSSMSQGTKPKFDAHPVDKKGNRNEDEQIDIGELKWVERSCQAGREERYGFAPAGISVRNCTVPLGHAIFFSVMAGNCSTLEAPPFFGGNEEELRACIHSIIDLTTVVTCEVDGVPIEGINDYRLQTPLFAVSFPPDNVAGVPGGGNALAVAEGWFIMLAPP